MKTYNSLKARHLEWFGDRPQRSGRVGEGRGEGDEKSRIRRDSAAVFFSGCIFVDARRCRPSSVDVLRSLPKGGCCFAVVGVVWVIAKARGKRAGVRERKCPALSTHRMLVQGSKKIKPENTLHQNSTQKKKLSAKNSARRRVLALSRLGLLRRGPPGALLGQRPKGQTGPRFSRLRARNLVTCYGQLRFHVKHLYAYPAFRGAATCA